MDDRCHSTAAQGWQLGNRDDIIGAGLIKAHDKSDECAMNMCVCLCVHVCKRPILYMAQITNISVRLQTQCICMNALFWATDKSGMNPSNWFMAECYKRCDTLVQLCVTATNGSICKDSDSCFSR